MTRKVDVRSKFSPLHTLLGVAVLALLVMPLAFAGAQGPSATSSKAKGVTAAKIKQLTQRIAALENRGSTPSGLAGGDLAGAYPDPVIAQDAVGSNEVIDTSLTGADIGTDTLGASDIALNGVGTDEIGADTVGSSELKGVTTRVSPAGAGSNNSYAENSVTCGSGEILLAGGYAWQNDATITMTSTAPSDSVSNAWVVRGKSSTSNNLFAWANCLAV